MNLRLIGLIISIVLFVFLLSTKFQKKWKKRLILLTSILLIMFTAFKYVVPLKRAPKPSGDKEVLTDQIYYKHKSQFPNMETGDGKREIPVSVWNPKDVSEKKSSIALIFSWFFWDSFI